MEARIFAVALACSSLVGCHAPASTANGPAEAGEVVAGTAANGAAHAGPRDDAGPGAVGALPSEPLELGVTDSVDDFGIDFAGAHADGMSRTTFYTRWRDLEPSDGNFTFGDIDDILTRTSAAGLKLTLEIEITSTDCVEWGMTDAECVTPLLPTDMPFSRKGAAYDDPVMIRRLTALVGALSARYDPSLLTHVFVGNEVDRYMRVVEHDDGTMLLPGFARMLGAIRDEVAATHPVRPRIGTVAEFQPYEGYLDTPKAVCPMVDVLGYTMYPTEPDAEGTDPPTQKIQRWLSVGRATVSPCALVVAEVGASAVAPHGSPTDQAALAGAVLTWMRDHPNQYQYVSWFSMFDNPELSDSVFGGMGLMTRDRAKRPAYWTWMAAGKR